MKRACKAALFLLSIICLFALAMGVTDNPEPQYTIDTPYEYPILPGTQEWIDLDDTLARRRACQIPEEVLHNMTTAALFQSVLDYPFLCDMYAFNTIQLGYETVKRRFNGLQELESRPEYLDELTNYCLQSYSLEEGEKSLKDYMAEDMYRIVSSELDTENFFSNPYGDWQHNKI